MLGGDFELSQGTWTCGKDGQSVPVGIGTPTMKIAEITVGGTQDPMTAKGGGGRRVPDPKACQHLAEQMLAIVRKAGADGAEVLVRDGAELEVKVRLGETELIKEAGSRALGLRVIKDERSAVTYTSDLTTAGMERLARDSVELAALAEPDPTAALPAAEEMARDVPELDLWDDAVLVARRRRRDPPRARGRGGGAGVRQARHQLRRRGVRADRGRVRVRDVGRVFGIGARHARVVRGRASVRRRRRQEAQRIVLDGVAVCRRARGSRRRRRRGGAAHRGQAGRAQDPDRRGARDLLAGRRRAGCSASSPA